MMSRRLPTKFSVRIENLNPQVSVDEVQQFFQGKIGQVTSVHEHVIASTLQRWIEVGFETDEAARRAIGLTGMPFHGMPIFVGQLFDPDLLLDSSPQIAAPTSVDENRRNLYVLGLPHDFTLDEFKLLFSTYGQIEHAVILAVLDNFSRRRGFVVFSTNAQARVAMRAVHKATIKGHQLNVSWAVVQRSSGFLDGADRTGGIDGFSDASGKTKFGSHNRPPIPIPQSNRNGSDVMYSQLGQVDSPPPAQPEAGMGDLGTAFASTLLVSNLCPWLFQTHIDVHALFAPFGFVKRITIIPPAVSSTTPDQDVNHLPHAALIEYDDLQNALSALYQVNGRPFGTCIARASLFRDAMQKVVGIQQHQHVNLDVASGSFGSNHISNAQQASLNVH